MGIFDFEIGLPEICVHFKTCSLTTKCSSSAGWIISQPINHCKGLCCAETPPACRQIASLGAVASTVTSTTSRVVFLRGDEPQKFMVMNHKWMVIDHKFIVMTTNWRLSWWLTKDGWRLMTTTWVCVTINGHIDHRNAWWFRITISRLRNHPWFRWILQGLTIINHR